MSSELRLKVATVWRGEWSAEVAYNVLDEVSFSAEAEGVKRGNYRSLLAANREPLSNKNAWVLVLDLEKTQSATKEAETMNKSFAEAESKRASAESARVSAEKGRVEAENKRVSAESGRVDAENKRVSAESARADAETNRRTAEKTRISNEQARVSAERGRADAESNRRTTEETIISNEQARVSAENSRAAAEAGRATAFANAQNEREEAFNAAEAGRNALVAEKVEDITRLQGEVAKKANIDGYYSSMAVGAAESLIGQNVTTQQFTFQPTGNTLDVQDGLAVVKNIKGNTVVANQLLHQQLPTYALCEGCKLTTTSSYVQFTITDPEAVEVRAYNIEGWMGYKVKKPTDKHFIKITYSGSEDLIFSVSGVGATQAIAYMQSSAKRLVCSGNKKTSCFIDSGNTGGYVAVYFADRWIKPQIGQYLRIYNIEFVSLTQMFDEGNEPTAEEFEKLYPNFSTEYNKGSLLNLNADRIKSVGFNAFNGEYAKVLGGMQYYLGGNITSLVFKENLEDDGEVIEIPSDNLYTPKTNGYLVASGDNICINLSHSGYRNGEYEPYKESIVNLPIKKYFPDGMKSAGEVRDEIVWDEGLKKYKAIQRIGIRAYQTDDENLTDARTDKTITYYILETPIETIIDDYDGINYEVSDFGTEEILSNEPTTPIVIDVVYGVNAVDTLRRLPQTYISADSMRGFLAQLGSAMNGNWTMEYDDVNSKWVFTFTATEVIDDEEQIEL